MKIKYSEIGICGLSCRLCPTYHAETKSKCGGCKSEYRMAAGCPFITCAAKRKKESSFAGSVMKIKHVRSGRIIENPERTLIRLNVTRNLKMILSSLKKME